MTDISLNKDLIAIESKQEKQINKPNIYTSSNYLLSFQAPLNKASFLLLLEISKLIKDGQLLDFCNLALGNNNFIKFDRNGNILKMLCPSHNDKHWGSVYFKKGSAICYACSTIFNFYSLLSLKKHNNVYLALENINPELVENLVNSNKLLLNHITDFKQFFIKKRIDNPKMYFDFLNTMKVVANCSNSPTNFNLTKKFFENRGFRHREFIKKVGAISFIGGYNDFVAMFEQSFKQLEANSNKNANKQIEDGTSNDLIFSKPNLQEQNENNKTKQSYCFTFNDFLNVAYAFNILNDNKNDVLNYRKSILYNRITIPLRNNKGQIVNLDNRTNTKTSYLTKYLFLKQETSNKELNKVLEKLDANNSHFVYKLDNASDITHKASSLPLPTSNLMFLNEGIFDTLSLSYFGLNAGCVFSANITKQQLKEIFKLSQNYKIVISLDNDDAGVSGILRSCKELVLNGVCYPMVLIPTKEISYKGVVQQNLKDWNDILKASNNEQDDCFNNAQWDVWYKTSNKNSNNSKDASVFHIINNFLLNEFKTKHYVSIFVLLTCLLILKVNLIGKKDDENEVIQLATSNHILSSYLFAWKQGPSSKTDFYGLISDYFKDLMFIDVVRNNEDISSDYSFLQKIATGKWLLNSAFKDELAFFLNPNHFLTLMQKNIIANYNVFLNQEKILKKYTNKELLLQANQEKFFKVNYKLNQLNKSVIASNSKQAGGPNALKEDDATNSQLLRIKPLK